MQMLFATIIFIIIEFVTGFIRYIFISGGLFGYFYEVFYTNTGHHANIFRIAYMAVDYGTLGIMVGGIIVYSLYAMKRESVEYRI